MNIRKWLLVGLLLLACLQHLLCLENVQNYITTLDAQIQIQQKYYYIKFFSSYVF